MGSGHETSYTFEPNPVPRVPVDRNTWEQKSDEKRGRPDNYMSDGHKKGQ